MASSGTWLLHALSPCIQINRCCGYHSDFTRIALTDIQLFATLRLLSVIWVSQYTDNRASPLSVFSGSRPLDIFCCDVRIFTSPGGTIGAMLEPNLAQSWLYVLAYAQC